MASGMPLALLAIVPGFLASAAPSGASPPATAANSMFRHARVSSVNTIKSLQVADGELVMSTNGPELLGDGGMGYGEHSRRDPLRSIVLLAELCATIDEKMPILHDNEDLFLQKIMQQSTTFSGAFKSFQVGKDNVLKDLSALSSMVVGLRCTASTGSRTI